MCSQKVTKALLARVAMPLEGGHLDQQPTPAPQPVAVKGRPPVRSPQRAVAFGARPDRLHRGNPIFPLGRLLQPQGDQGTAAASADQRIDGAHVHLWRMCT